MRLLNWRRKRKQHLVPTYHADQLCVWHKSTHWLREPRFLEAYSRGVNSGHKLGEDMHIEWRVHVLCWAARQAAMLPGDFVECGVNTGIFSLAIAHYIDFNRTGKHLYLFDTFAGIPKEQITDRELALGREVTNSHYEDCYDLAKRNFADYPNAHFIRGKIPESLTDVSIDKVCYLSIDMNIAAPEVAAIRHFWGKLSAGAPVILDDYGWLGHDPQREAMDEFADSVGCAILTLPTGQGLLLKPPA